MSDSSENRRALSHNTDKGEDHSLANEWDALRIVSDRTLYQCASPSSYGMLKQYARENRKYMTDAEKMLWEELRLEQLGVKVQRQYIIKDYIVDFVCLENNLIIEVDGAYHFEPKQQILDEYRQSDLKGLGFKVLRFSNEDIMCNMNDVIDKIKHELMI